MTRPTSGQMVDLALIGGRVMADGQLQSGKAVLIAGGWIVDVAAQQDVPRGVPIYNLDGRILLPGFIDVQVNGGGNVLFNDAPTPETIAQIGAAHRRFGTTGFFPTLISDSLECVAQAISATSKAIAEGVPGVLGVHIEGPFLNAARKGIHEAGALRVLDAEAVATLKAPCGGRMLVTLAPEKVEDCAIRALAGAGVVIAAGHSDASYARMQTAFEAGVTGITHLFNAMSPLTSREPGLVGAALSADAWCGLIVDGRHVDPVVLKIALACRPDNRFMLVTDAMPCVGSDAASFALQGKAISVRDGACYDASGRLAGSNLDMASALRNAVAWLGIDLATASQMASANPADFMGLGAEYGRIAPGYHADLVLLDDALRVRETWIGGVASGAVAHAG